MIDLADVQSQWARGSFKSSQWSWGRRIWICKFFPGCKFCWSLRRATWTWRWALLTSMKDNFCSLSMWRRLIVYCASSEDCTRQECYSRISEAQCCMRGHIGLLLFAWILFSLIYLSSVCWELEKRCLEESANFNDEITKAFMKIRITSSIRFTSSVLAVHHDQNVSHSILAQKMSKTPCHDILTIPRTRFRFCLQWMTEELDPAS